MRPRINIGNQKITLENLRQVLYHTAQISVTDEALAKVNRSFSFLKGFSKDKVIYGVNTGFGPMAPYIIRAEQSKALQYNLIRSHAAGTGKVFANGLPESDLIGAVRKFDTGTFWCTRGRYFTIANLDK